MYIQLCKYLRNPVTVLELNARLFTRLLQCSETELKDKLNVDCLSARVKKIAHQLYKEGLVIDAGSLLAQLQDFRVGVGTLNDAIGYVQRQ